MRWIAPILTAALTVAAGCRGDEPELESGAGDLDHDEARQVMVSEQLRDRDIESERIMEAMAEIPRHRFVPDDVRDVAYADRPLPIGHGQTISQPYIVALMTQLADPDPGDKALDIGSGSGYQAAVLAHLVDHVYAIEIVGPLADQAAERFEALGLDNVTLKHADGYHGWPEHAPYDVIVVAAAADHVPPALIQQLAPDGRLLIPVGRFEQRLMLIHKREDGQVVTRPLLPVRFVPMTGDAR